MSKPLALVIDDEPDIRELLSLTLGRMNIDTAVAEDIKSAKALLSTKRFDICLTDMRLPDGDGLELIEWMQKNASGVPVAVITAHGNVETAVQALKLGAFDFISKPLDLQNLRKMVENALKLRDRHAGETSQLLGDSPAMQELRDLIDRVNSYSSVEAQQMWNEGMRFEWGSAARESLDEFKRRLFDEQGLHDGERGILLSTVMGFYKFLNWAKLWELENNPDAGERYMPYRQALLHEWKGQRRDKSEPTKRLSCSAAVAPHSRLLVTAASASSPEARRQIRSAASFLTVEVLGACQSLYPVFSCH